MDIGTRRVRCHVCYSLSLCVFFLTGCLNQSSSAPVIERSLATGKRPDTYQVRHGDTLYSIAWVYRLDYRNLAKINHIQPPYILRNGQILQIKKPKIKPVNLNRTQINQLKWQWPAQGKVINQFSTQDFGNKGINIAGRLGSPIRATASGFVVYSGAGLRGYGNLLIIKHNQHYLTAYAFNLRNLAKEGMKVRRGQKIAEMGQDDSGRVMLYFEIRHDGVPVNPLLFLH